MTILFCIINFLVIAWSGYLLNTKTKLKWWECLITQWLVVLVFCFIGIILARAKLI